MNTNNPFLQNDSESSEDEWDEELREREEKRRKLHNTTSKLAVAVATLCGATGESPDGRTKKSVSETSASRSPKRTTMLIRDSAGQLVPMTPRLSPWYYTYVAHPQPNDGQWLQKFRLRFRAAYHAFLQLLSLVTADDAWEFFARWTVHKASYYHKRTPIELLTLGSLRYVGRGWTFDDLEEATGIGEEVHRVFFHAFIKFGAKSLFKVFVPLPSTSDGARCAAY